MSTLTQLLGGIGNAFYTPKLNAYGMKNGVPVDKDGNPTSLFVNPSGFERAFNPIAQGIQQENAQASGASLLSQQEQQNKTGADISRINAMGALSPEQVTTASGLGMMSPEAINAAHLGQARENSGYYPMTAGAEASQAGSLWAANPAEAYPGIRSNVMRDVMVGTPTSEYEKEFLARHPGIEQGGPRMWQLDPGAGTAGAIGNPTSLMGAYLGGQGGGMSTVGGAPSGASYNIPSAPPDYGAPPPIGNSSAVGAPQAPPTYIPKPADNTLRPLHGQLEGYQLDPDGNLYFNGTFVPEENYKGTELGKAVSSNVSMQKAVENFHKQKSLPHGLKAELLGTGSSLLNAPYGPYNTAKAFVNGYDNMLSRGYHSLIGE